MEQIVFWAIWAALAVFMGYFYLHHAHGIRSFLRGTGTGLVALLLLHELGGWSSSRGERFQSHASGNFGCARGSVDDGGSFFSVRWQ